VRTRLSIEHPLDAPTPPASGKLLNPKFFRRLLVALRIRYPCGFNTMKLLNSLWVPHFVTHVGKCGRCMHQSFLVAAISVIAFASTWLYFGQWTSPVSDIGAVIAFSSVSLWLTHVTAFATRISKEHSDDHDLLSRRKLMIRFVSTALVTAAATAMPGVSYAWNECPGRLNCGPSSCTNMEVYCCPKGYPVLNLCNCRCYSNVHDIISDGCGSTGSCFDQNF